MYAIIEDGGRQFKVEMGTEFDIDFREDVNKGDAITFDRVLTVRTDDDIKIGEPLVEGATVKAEALGAELGPKLTIQKFRRRKNSRRKTGHRQAYTRVVITEING